ncbi:MarR family winged helix-turn-helix transcriptional regulator [Leptospira ilyithenensis]|uniref:MarR family transcriptional regulator n=1 Tax=Leptospira ilyithenensis TaxID=2484901 RepID=A0A4R9LRP1_9LEPT|nr:MarR family winged helix-turn-helix transcriptional regulator [Leptospira ilyithenensis]TGN10896.1 MarR family transcriptional regulator [Leptospira ilyithenensis]
MNVSKQDLEAMGRVCLNFNLRKTTRLITSYYDLHLKPSGIRITQFTILLSIAHQVKCSITDLNGITDIDRTTLQRSLEILRRDGLVQIEKAESGNVRSVSLTKKGEKKLEDGIDLWKKAQTHMEKELGKEKLTTGLRLLHEIRKAVPAE